ncbi:hypothetical protein [Peijinzhouia sedimentorum]
MTTIHNDVELDGKYIGKITTDFLKVCDTIKEASQQIRERGFSEYPIFPMCQQLQPVGSLLFERGRQENEWNYYMTYVDEFIQRKLIEDEENFKRVYKNPDEFCCLFVIDAKFTNFIFVPYPED